MDFRLDNLFDNFEPLIILIKIRYSWEGGDYLLLPKSNQLIFVSYSYGVPFQD